MLLLDICILTQSSFPIIVVMLKSFTLPVIFLFISCLIVSLFHQLEETQVRQKETTETTRAGCNASNFLLSWSLNVCALSLPLHHRINLLFHLPVPPSSRSLIHLISASWLVQSLPPFSAGSSSVRPALLAAPYSGDVVSLGVIVPVAERSIGRNCVAATVELRREGTNWILAQSM